jgi:predicted transcriptional regulator YdeE
MPTGKTVGLTSQPAEIPGMLDIPFTIRKVPAKIVVGLSCRTATADGRSGQDVPALWGEFLKQKVPAKIQNRVVPPVIYAVYSDYASDWRGEFTYLLGCGVTRTGTVPEGMEVCQIPAQTYAVFTAKGQMPDEVLAIWCLVWLSELSRTYTYDFEVYDKRFTNPKQKVVDIFISVDPEKIKTDA